MHVDTNDVTCFHIVARALQSVFRETESFETNNFSSLRNS